MPQSDNLKKLYDNVGQEYELPDYNTFVTDMQDDGKRKKFYEGVREDYELPEYDVFNSDMGFEKKTNTQPSSNGSTTTTQTTQASQKPEPFTAATTPYSVTVTDSNLAYSKAKAPFKAVHNDHAQSVSDVKEALFDAVIKEKPSKKLDLDTRYRDEAFTGNDKLREGLVTELQTKFPDYKKDIKLYSDELMALKQDIRKNLAAVHLNSGDTKSMYALGENYLSLGDTDKAETTFKAVLSMSPDDPLATEGLAFIAKEKGDNKSAEELYTKASQLNPNTRNINNLALSKVANGKVDEALKLTAEVLTINPDDAQAYKIRGYAKSASGDVQGGIADTKKGAEIQAALQDAGSIGESQHERELASRAASLMAFADKATEFVGLAASAVVPEIAIGKAIYEGMIGTVDGFKDIKKAYNKEGLLSAAAQTTATAVRGVFTIATAKSPQIQRFVSGMAKAEMVLPHEVVGLIMQPISTAMKIDGNSSYLSRSVAEILDLPASILIFHAATIGGKGAYEKATKLAEKIRNNEPITKAETEQLTEAVSNMTPDVVEAMQQNIVKNDGLNLSEEAVTESIKAATVENTKAPEVTEANVNPKPDANVEKVVEPEIEIKNEKAQSIPDTQVESEATPPADTGAKPATPAGDVAARGGTGGETVAAGVGGKVAGSGGRKGDERGVETKRTVEDIEADRKDDLEKSAISNMDLDSRLMSDNRLSTINIWKNFGLNMGHYSDALKKAGWGIRDNIGGVDFNKVKENVAATGDKKLIELTNGAIEYIGELRAERKAKMKEAEDETIKAQKEINAKYDAELAKVKPEGKPLTSEQAVADNSAAPSVKQGDTIQLAPQIKNGLPRKMVFDNGTWKQQVGKELSDVGKTVQQQASETFNKQNEQQRNPNDIKAGDSTIPAQTPLLRKDAENKKTATDEKSQEKQEGEKENVTLKTKNDAVQKSSAKKLDARQQAGNGETVGKGNTPKQETPPKGSQEKVSPEGTPGKSGDSPPPAQEQAGKPVTPKEAAKQRLDAARAAFKKAGGLSSGGLESLPEFVELVKAYINKGLVDAKEFIKELRAEYPESKKSDKEIEDAFNKVKDSEIKDAEKPLSGIKKALAPEEKIQSTPIERRSKEQMFERGKQLVDEGSINPRVIVEEIVTTKGARALQPDEVAALVYYKTKLDASYDRVFDAIEAAQKSGDTIKEATLKAELGVISKDTDAYHEMSIKTAYEQSLAFRLRQMLVDSEYNLQSQIRKYKSVNKGEISPEVEAKFKQYDEELKAVNKKIRDLENDLSEKNEEIAKKQAEEIAKKTKREEKTEVIREERRRILSSISTKLKQVRSQTKATVVPYANELIAIAPEMSKLIRNYAKEGVLKFEELVDKIHSDLTSHVPPITKKDVIDLMAGKYKIPKGAKENPHLSEAERALEIEKMKIKESFDVEIEKAKIKNQPFSQKASDVLADVINTARATKAGFDLSFPGRQGIFYLPTHPIRFGQAFSGMLKDWWSAEKTKEWMYRLKTDFDYPLIKESVFLAEPHSKMSAREELFQSNMIRRIEQIPVAGKIVKATVGKLMEKSERAYGGMGNRLRVGIFRDAVQQLKDAGVTDPRLYKQMGELINSGTGRGDLGAAEPAAKWLSMPFFSLRFQVSRFQTILRPLLDPRLSSNHQSINIFGRQYWSPVRKIAVKDLAGYAAFVAVTLYLAKQAGADVEDDLDSPDALKIKMGDTRIDVLGGFQQYVVHTAKMYSGERGDKKINRGNESVLFLRKKAAPFTGATLNLMFGKNVIGEKTDLKNELKTLYTPMIYDGTKEAVEKYGAGSGAMRIFLPSFVGLGAQDYDNRK